MVGVGAVTAAGVKGSLRRPSAALDPGSRGSGNATRCDTPPETVTERHMLRLGTPPTTTPPPLAHGPHGLPRGRTGPTEVAGGPTHVALADRVAPTQRGLGDFVPRYSHSMVPGGL